MKTRIGPFLPVFRDRDHDVEAIHLHGAVAHAGDTVRSGNAILRRHRVRRAGAERGEAARERCLHAAADLEIARIPVGDRTGIGGDDALSGSRGDNSQNTRCGLSGSAEFIARSSSSFHQRFHIAFDLAHQAVSVFCFNIGSSARKVAALSPTMIDFHRIAQAESAAVDVDLNASRRVPAWEEIRCRERPNRPSTACRSLSSDPNSAWYREVRCDPVTKGRSSGTTALPSSALATPACSRSATAITSSVASSAPAPTSMATFLPLLRTSAAARSARFVGQFGRPRIAHAGMRRAVRHRRILVRQELQIVRQNDAGDRALGVRDPHGAVDQMAHLLGNAGEADELAGHILEQSFCRSTSC